MEEYAVLQDHKLALDYREGQRVNGRYNIDPEEAEYWRQVFNEPIIEIEKESDKPFLIMIVVPAIFEGYRSLKDKTLKVTLELNELNPQELLGIAENLGQYGYFAFKKEPFREEERLTIEQLESDYEDKGKTPSKRLRAVLYRNYEQDNDGFDTFTRYYENSMEKIINHFKSKLD